MGAAPKRADVTFESAGAAISAWFYAPSSDARAPWPCVVMGHGFAAVKEARLDAFAERFAEAGLACLVFDYRHFGGSGGEPRQVIDIGRQQEDWRSALVQARSRADVDRERIALWGTSFGGGHVLEVASRDPGIRAAVLHMPFVDSLASAKEEGVQAALRLGAAGLLDAWRRARRRAPYVIPVVGRPGSLAVMTQPEAEPGYLSIVTKAPSWRNAVAARIVLEMLLFRPGRRASNAACPLLFVVGTRDTITPPLATLAAALRAPQAEIITLPIGHFAAYRGGWFERASDAETAFLARHLEAPVSSAEAGRGSGPQVVTC